MGAPGLPCSPPPRRPPRGRWLVPGLACLALLIPGMVLAAAGADTRMPDFALEDRVRAVAEGLRCVVCQNLSVADSPSDLAKEMRNLVREQIQQGKSPEEIRAYFVSRYGEFVLLAPPKRGFNLLLWGLPFLAILAGACGVYLVARRWTAQREPGPAADPEYAERVRRELRERTGQVGS
ncbi:MAG TPA: cytochrome c-type biogenesis protein [Candidatus Methylomirabilis sp.]|nr:cytochrome c-type biogenesis protein [Candidatus Methylomirabilis sp.]